MPTKKEKIGNLIRKRQIREAFLEVSKEVMTDQISQTYFLQILRVVNNVAILQGDMEAIHEAADKGNPYMMLAYARFHECLAPEADSMDVSVRYYESAIEAGIADARAYLAYFHRDGDFGEVDVEKYHDLLRQAVDEGSEKAAQQILRDTIFGNNGIDANPREACDEITEYIERCKDEGIVIDPAYYSLLADADRQLGRRGAAMDGYERAFDNGYLPALFNLAYLSCCDDDGDVIDHKEYRRIMNRGRECMCQDSFLTLSVLMDGETYDNFTDDKKVTIHEQMSKDLDIAVTLGDGFGAYFLAMCHENGTMGFEQDYAKAFTLYSRGAVLRNASCYEAMVRMILDDGTAPEGYGDRFAYSAAYKCLMLGGDTLEIVIRGYKNGFLTEHAAAIEQIYMPRYEQYVSDMMDDHDIDDEPIIDDPDTFHAAEREVGEDDWTMDPDIDLTMQTCAECAQKVETLMQGQDRMWEVADIARKFIAAAKHVMSDNDSLTDQLYGYSNTIKDALSDHPRLKLLLMQMQLEMLKKVEAGSQHELIISDELKKEIARYEKNIALADEGRLSEIEQSGYLKRDPIEWTKEWENVVDEAEKIACSHLTDFPRGMGFCFAYWAERKAALARFGIEWRTPHQMNPRVIFD